MSAFTAKEIEYQEEQRSFRLATVDGPSSRSVG
jgi:hypothetical protein